MDTFQRVKMEIFKRELPVRIAWEYHDADSWSMEIEERASASRFRVDGNNESRVADIVKTIEANTHALRRQHKDNGGDRPAPGSSLGFRGSSSSSGRRVVRSSGEMLRSGDANPFADEEPVEQGGN